MTKEYRKYDTQDRYEIHNARLAVDPKVYEGDKGKLVTLTFVSTSRSEKSIDLWVDAKVSGFNSELAAFLKKGDSIGVRGKPSMEAWEDKDGNERTSFTLFMSDIMVPPALFAELKERGWVPGAQNQKVNAKGAKGPAGKAKPAAKGAAKPAAKRPIEEPDEDEIDLDDDDGEE